MSEPIRTKEMDRMDVIVNIIKDIKKYEKLLKHYNKALNIFSVTEEEYKNAEFIIQSFG